MSIVKTDADLGDFGGLRYVEIHYYYWPEERATRDEPGCPEWWEITKVIDIASGIDLWKMVPPKSGAGDRMVELIKECF